MSNASITKAATDAIIAKTTTDLAPIQVGDGAAPAGVPAGRPWVIVDVMTGLVAGTLAQDDRFVKHTIQFRCVGMSRQAAEHARDEVRRSVLARDLVIDGVTVSNTVHEISGMAVRDTDGHDDPRWSITERFAYHLESDGA